MSYKSSPRVVASVWIVGLLFMQVLSASAQSVPDEGSAANSTVYMPLVTNESQSAQQIEEGVQAPEQSLSESTTETLLEDAAETVYAAAYHAAGNWTVGGRVGIGTETPAGPLHINTAFGAPPSGLPATQNGLLLGVQSLTGYKWIQSYGGNLALNPLQHNVGIGTDNPRHRLSIAGGPLWTSSAWRGSVELMNSSAIGWQANTGTWRFGMGHTDGGFYLFRTVSDSGTTGSSAIYDMVINDSGNVGIGTTSPQTTLHVNGTTTTKVLQITGGADLAEPFAVTGADTLERGMVVAIDPANPGQLRIADKAYDRTVAGVVSGAGGINPGLILQQEGTMMAGEHPIALTGRVYVWANATTGAIQPGDLLTTSDTPGYAMKVIDYEQAQGAILGKAMTALQEGVGLVLVLVTLQ